MRILKYLLIWFLLSVPFLLSFTIVWILLGDSLTRTGIKFEYLILVAFELSAIVFLIFYIFSSKLLLKWYRAEEVVNSELYEMFRKIADYHGVSARLFSLKSDMPNAFYAGNARNGFVVITSALKELLDEEELEAVLTSEILRLKNKESMVYTITAAISGIIVSVSTLAYWLSLLTGFGVEDDPAPNLIKLFTMSIVAPFASFPIHLIVPGKKEYFFDEECLKLLKNQEKLMTAMEKAERFRNNGVNFAHSFLFFSNPLHKEYANILDFNLPTYATFFKMTPGTRRRILKIGGVDGGKEKTGIIKPIFYSLISFLLVLFGIIAFDTFSRKDFVFERAFTISAVFMGTISIFLILLSAVIWVRRRSL